jgi:phosphoribosylanthranilate isomerase
LFVNASADEIRRVVDRVGLSAVQLHGHEPPEMVRVLQPLRIIKSIPIEPTRIDNDLRQWKAAIERMGLKNLVGLVMETANTGQAGGSGVANDWTTLKRCVDSGIMAGLPPLIAAGGLTPDNVGQVVRDLRPWAVDVSSGVEIVKGMKSPDKIAAFVKAVRAEDGNSR